MVVEAAESIKGKVGETFVVRWTRFRSRALVTIKCDVEMIRGPHDLEVTGPNEDLLREMFARMEFKTWLSELLEGEDTSPSPETSAQKGEYETVFDGALRRLG